VVTMIDRPRFPSSVATLRASTHPSRKPSYWYNPHPASVKHVTVHFHTYMSSPMSRNKSNPFSY
jgi:hypothetical protein